MANKKVFSRLAIVLSFLAIFISGFYIINSTFFASGFTGPTTSPGIGGGLFTTDDNKNLSVGTSTPQANTRFLIVSSSTASNSFGLKVLNIGGSPLLVVRSDGSVGVGTSTPDAGTFVVQGTIYSSGNFTGNIAAANVTAGTFAPGNFAFPGSLGVATSSQVGLPANFTIYGTSQMTATTTIQSTLVIDSGSLSGATTTVTIGDAGHPACLKLRDKNDGGWTYLTVQSGAGTFSAASCE